MGHLIRLANQIAGNTRSFSFDTSASLGPRKDHSEEDSRLQEELDEETFHRWSEFFTGQVMDMNRKNNTNLVSNGVGLKTQ